MCQRTGRHDFQVHVQEFLVDVLHAGPAARTHGKAVSVREWQVVPLVTLLGDGVTRFALDRRDHQPFTPRVTRNINELRL